MKVLFFAQSRQLAGATSWLLETNRSLTQSEFWDRLIEAFPVLDGQQRSTRLARNETYLNAEDLLLPGDEIAVIPPVSGG